MRADASSALRALPLLFALGACSWFTDFRDQPRYEPWESEADSIAFRGNPQLSVPMHGMPAPGLLVSYRPVPPVIDSVAAIVGANPIAPTAWSLENGRKSYQINCAVCHGVGGAGDGAATKYGVIGLPLTGATTMGLSDGQIFGIIRNGRGMMPTYNRIPETERWDIVNYIRGLQGRHQVVTAPAGFPGETGATLPAATEMAPTRPAPYYKHIGSQAGVPLGPRDAAPATGTATANVVAPGADPAGAPPVVVRTAPDTASASPDSTRGSRS